MKTITSPYLPNSTYKLLRANQIKSPHYLSNSTYKLSKANQIKSNQITPSTAFEHHPLLAQPPVYSSLQYRPPLRLPQPGTQTKSITAMKTRPITNPTAKAAMSNNLNNQQPQTNSSSGTPPSANASPSPGQPRTGPRFEPSAPTSECRTCGEKKLNPAFLMDVCKCGGKLVYTV